MIMMMMMMMIIVWSLFFNKTMRGVSPNRRSSVKYREVAMILDYGLG